MNRTTLGRALRTVPWRFWAGLGFAFLLLLLIGYSTYQKRYGPGSDYHTGFLLGGSSFITENLKGLGCLEAEIDALQRHDESPIPCTVKKLEADSVIEETAWKLLPDMGGDELRGFRDGWRTEMQKTDAQRAKTR